MIGGSCNPCCEQKDPCNIAVTKVSITFDTLPANCVNRPGNFNGSYMIRDLPLFNGCAIPLFKTSAPGSCVFTGAFPARENSSTGGCNVGLSVVYRPLLEEIVIGGINAVVLKPEAGKSFRSLPYSGGVVMQSNTFATCTTQQWNAVTVTIATEPSSLAITACPANTLCTAGVDTLPSPPAGYAYHDDMTCPPCSSDRIVLSDFRNQNLLFNGYGGIAEIPDATIEVEFDSGSQYYYSGLGTQTLTLKYSSAVTTEDFVPSPATVVHPTLGPIADPAISSLGCGWAGIFEFPPGNQSGEPVVNWPGVLAYSGPGYKYPPYDVFGTTVGPYYAATSLRASITPVGWYMPLDRSTSPLPALGTNPCNDSRIAYVLKLIVRHTYTPVNNSGFWKSDSYWEGSSGVSYFAIPCTARQCHDGVPQFQGSSVVPYLRYEQPTSGSATTQSSHTVTVSVL